MYTFNGTTSRCALCYALLSTNTTTTGSPVAYSSSSSSSSHRRHATRCSIASLERLISSSRKFERLWQKNENRLVQQRSVCCRCAETIRQIEQIKTNIEQLNGERQVLLNKMEHQLYKRALILQGHRQRSNPTMPFQFNHQQIPYIVDEDTEEGEEKPRPVVKTNGQEHPSPLVVTTATLVGAKRRKCNVAHKIHIEDKSSLLNHTRHSDSPKAKFTPSLFFGTHSSNHRRAGLLSSAINGHSSDLANLTFSSAYKALSLQTPSATGTTSPYIDPTTGALIAIVSNPHHAALLAQQHQQILQSSSISPSSNHTIDEHELVPSKLQQPPPPSLQKKFPCQLCGRDFSNKSNLNRHHSIVHVALRNFECARCPKKFKLRQGLKTHMQRCHGVNADEPTFVLQKHSAHHHHHHHHHPTFAQSK